MLGTYWHNRILSDCCFLDVFNLFWKHSHAAFATPSGFLNLVQREEQSESPYAAAGTESGVFPADTVDR